MENRKKHLPRNTPEGVENLKKQKAKQNYEERKEKAKLSVAENISQLSPEMVNRRRLVVESGEYDILPIWKAKNLANSKAPDKLKSSELIRMKKGNPAEFYRFMINEGKNEYGMPCSEEECKKVRIAAQAAGYNLEEYTRPL
ncbi:MAG: hypothetical protein AAGF07_05125 [Patescibacteria group bacterium]